MLESFYKLFKNIYCDFGGFLGSFVSWPLFYCSRVHVKMAAESGMMESESNLDYLDNDGSSDGVSSVTLNSLMTAIQDINRNIERKFSEMENNLKKTE